MRVELGAPVVLVYRQLTAAGYELRTVGEALALRNHKHGRKPRAVSVGPEAAAYRRWRAGRKSPGSSLNGITLARSTATLYRACNWTWAPTWHRLRPPPSGNGSWSNGQRQEVKDRWVFPLRPDQRRPEILAIKDEAVVHAVEAG